MKLKVVSWLRCDGPIYNRRHVLLVVVSECGIEHARALDSNCDTTPGRMQLSNCSSLLPRAELAAESA